MIENIRKYSFKTNKTFDFTIVIPTWNNLEFIKLCLNSIQKNSRLQIQLIVIINEGKDGTIDWFSEQSDIEYIHAKENIGICYALNVARSMVRSEYMVYANDDMYFLPDWDTMLYQEIQRIGHKSFMLSSTMIEPTHSGNPCVSVADYGKSIHEFQEQKLLGEYKKYVKNDWCGSTWPPSVVHIDLWDLVGGLSIEFSPGMYSDPDFSMKLYKSGVRHFKGVGNSLVYHFGSKSTRRVTKNKGRNTFLMKWGITSNQFTKDFLKSGQDFDDPANKGGRSIIKNLINKLKRMQGTWS